MCPRPSCQSCLDTKEIQESKDNTFKSHQVILTPWFSHSLWVLGNFEFFPKSNWMSTFNTGSQVIWKCYPSSNCLELEIIPIYNRDSWTVAYQPTAGADYLDGPGLPQPNSNWPQSFGLLRRLLNSTEAFLGKYLAILQSGSLFLGCWLLTPDSFWDPGF